MIMVSLRALGKTFLSTVKWLIYSCLYTAKSFSAEDKRLNNKQPLTLGRELNGTFAKKRKKPYENKSILG